MTVLSTVNRFPYTGNGAQVTFPYTRKVFVTADVQVYVSGVLQVAGYTVTGVGNDNGGNVVFDTAPANLAPVLVLLVEPATQETSLPTSGPFPAKAVESMSDKLTMEIQQLAETDNRSLKVAVTSLFQNLLVPDPVTGKFLRWKDATALENADITSGGVLGLPVSTANGGTGSAFASLLALAQGLNLALWKKGANIVAAATITLPNPIDGNQIDVTGNTGITAISTTGVAEGTIVCLHFTGTPAITDGASLQLYGRTSYTAAAGDKLYFQLRGTTWTEVARVPLQAAANAAKFWRGDGTWSAPLALNGIVGLTLTNNAGDATNDIDVAVGSVASDDANPSAKEPMFLSALITKQLDVNWAVGTNQGGLDTGAIANGTYHVFLIKRVDTGVVDVLYSLSPTAPTMPANYTKKQRIGSILREAAAIVAFSQDQDTFYRKASKIDFDAVNPGTAAVLRALSVPTGIKVDAIVSMTIVGITTGNITVYASSPDQNDEAATVAATTPLANAGFAARDVNTSTWGSSGLSRVRTNTSAQIRTRLSASGAADRVGGITYGWYDTSRGRN
jgi:hypothetical protein